MNKFVFSVLSSFGLMFLAKDISVSASHSSFETWLEVRGQGFLAFTNSEGREIYSKSALLRADEQGRLINQDGYELKPSLSVGAVRECRVSKVGEISCDFSGDQVLVGQISIAVHSSPEDLEALGGGYYRENSAMELEFRAPGIKAGTLIQRD